MRKLPVLIIVAAAASLATLLPATALATAAAPVDVLTYGAAGAAGTSVPGGDQLTAGIKTGTTATWLHNGAGTTCTGSSIGFIAGPKPPQ